MKIKVLTVTMTWNELAQKWLMRQVRKDAFIYDFWDCGNVQLAFKGLDKHKPKTYKLTIECLEDGYGKSST